MAEVRQAGPLSDVDRGSRWQASDASRPVLEGAVLRVTRKPARLRDKLRAYRVLVDGASVGTIRDGQTADFSVPAGHQEVRLKLDWAGSRVLSLNVGVGEVAHLECEPAGSALMASFGVFACLGKHGRPWIELRQVSGNATAAPPESVWASPPSYDRYSPSPSVSTNGWSVAALALGIVWLGGVGSLLALIFGSVAKKQLARPANRQGGRGLAIAGIVLGWVGLAVLAALIVVAIVANNISTAPTPTTSTALSSTAAAHRYLALITPVNKVSDTFSREAALWNRQTTNAQAERQALPVITALQTFQQQLASTAWPPSTRQAATRLVSAVGPAVRDLQALASLSLSDTSSWVAQFRRDAAIVKTDDNVVRHDLGLPPSPPGGGKQAGTRTVNPSDGGGNRAGPGNSRAPGENVTRPAPTGNHTVSGGGGTTQGTGSCFGCVTITTVTWAFYAAPGTLTDYQQCLPRTATVTSNYQVAGPPPTNPTRQFTYPVTFNLGCTVPDGVEFTIGKVELQGADPPISIISTTPAIPFVLTPPTTQTLAVTFHALDGNYYNGPLVIDVILD